MVITSKTINYTVETVEELSTIVGQENDVIVVTDENRGGTFVYRSAEVSVNNGGAIFNGWCRQYDGAVNVKWFGAKGDGRTDDTIAFNNCSLVTKVAMCPKPSSSYKVSSTIANTNNTIFVFYGSSSILTGTATTAQLNAEFITTNGIREIQKLRLIGTKDSGTPDAIINVAKTHTAPNAGHAYKDSTVFNPSLTASYASYDSQIIVNGAVDKDHSIGFQSRPVVNSTGINTDVRGFGFYPRINSPVVNTKGLDIISASGSGTIQNEYGIYIDNLTRGINKYPIYVANNLGTCYFEARTQIEHILEVGGVRKLSFGGSSGTQFPEFSFNNDGKTGLKTSADYSMGWKFASTTMDLRHAPTGAIGDAPVWRNILTFRTTTVPGTVRPGVDNDQLFGDSASRWKEIYCVNSIINTSDEREKTFYDIDEIEKQIAIELKSMIKKFKWNEAIDKKGEDGARYHFGVGAQSVKSKFEEFGLDGFKYGILCYDKWDDEFDDDNNNTIVSGDRYGIRYNELVMFILGSL